MSDNGRGAYKRVDFRDLLAAHGIKLAVVLPGGVRGA